MARIYDPRRAEIYQRLGIPTVATVTWTIDQVRRRLLPDEDVGDWSDPSGRLTLVDRSLPESGPGGALRPGAPRPAEPGGGHPRRRARGSTPASSSARRATCCTWPSSTTPCRELDEALACAKGTSRDGHVRVAIAGAGSVGTAIAADLHANGHEVLVFEQDPELVERLRPTLDVTWVAADACEVSSLDAAGLATVDVVVAATGDDEDNLVISLLAKQEFAVPRVVARVNHPKNQWLFNESWGVDVSVSHAPAADRAGRGGGLGRRAGPPAAVPRRRAPTWSRSPWPRTRPANDIAIADLDFPATASWWPSSAPTASSCPRGDTVLQSGDEVLVLVTADAEDAVHALFIADSSLSRNPPQPPRQPRSQHRTFAARPRIVTLAQAEARAPVAWRDMEAAFFDLDKTVIDRASIAAFGRPFLKGGLINRRLVARAAMLAAHLPLLRRRRGAARPGARVDAGR